jgi:hypothetical protein
MGAGAIAWPRKQRELHNHHFDSTIWNDFAFRGDDIVIATYGKSGTPECSRSLASKMLKTFLVAALALAVVGFAPAPASAGHG